MKVSDFSQRVTVQNSDNNDHDWNNKTKHIQHEMKPKTVFDTLVTGFQGGAGEVNASYQTDE